MENAYAQALWQMVEKGPSTSLRTGMSPKEAVAKIREALEKRGRLSILPKVGRAFARIAAREGGKRAVVLSVAKEKDAAGAKREMKDIFREMGVEAGDVEVRLDETLIGGWGLEGRGGLPDARYKKNLLWGDNRAPTKFFPGRENLNQLS